MQRRAFLWAQTLPVVPARVVSARHLICKPDQAGIQTARFVYCFLHHNLTLIQIVNSLPSTLWYLFNWIDIHGTIGQFLNFVFIKFLLVGGSIPISFNHYQYILSYCCQLLWTLLKMSNKKSDLFSLER